IDIPELPENAITLPKGSVKLPDGSFHLPEGASVPEGATKLPDGNFKLPDDVPVVHEGAHPLHTPEGTGQVYGHPDGHIVDGNGNILIHADELQKPPPAGADLPHTPTPVKEPALVGAGAHTAADTAGHAGEHIRLGHSLDTDLGDTGRIGDNTHTTPTVHAGGEHPAGGGLGDHVPGGTAGNHLPTNELNNPLDTGHGDTPTTGGTHSGSPSATGDHGPGSTPGTHLPGRADDLGTSARAEILGAGGGSPAGRDLPGAHTGHTGSEGGTGHPEDPEAVDDLSGGDPADDLGDVFDDNLDDHADAGHGQSGDDPYAGQEPDYSRPALLPADGPLTLRDVRNSRDVATRWQRGEEFHRQMWGGGAERHYPVPTNSDPRYPVTATGGRKVDVPVDLPDGRTVAVEVKTYGQYRTITMQDGIKQTIKNEVPLSKHIKEQIHKDVALRRLDPNFDPRWSFTHAGPSAALREYLTKARIIFLEYGPAPKKS
ncbi:hypothetical protein AB0G56_31290, partial [Streptomyces sp. NPDC021356]